MRRVPVAKMHGAHNDFVIVDARRSPIDDVEAFGRWACDRRESLGADGLLVISASDTAHARMRVINADGSEAEMCGNGMRCIARYLDEAGEGDRLRVETLAGIIETQIVARDPEYRVRLTLGEPQIVRAALPFENAAFVVMGNPHVVIFDASLDALDLPTVAASLQSSALFPDGANVHVAVRTGPQSLAVRHWERGVGLTLACGTGSVACAAAAIDRGMVSSPVEVLVPGGCLLVEWNGRGPASLTGPAVRVFDGELLVEDAVLA